MTQRDFEKFEIVHPHAAGIDIGSKFHQVSAGEGAIDQCRFGVMTEDLHAIAEFLKDRGVTSVAMESTGYYWKNLFLLLQDYGFEVYLVNARQTRNVTGKKTDKIDANWIRKLHSCGFLTASFQPDAFSEEMRTYTRHRKKLIRSQGSYMQRMEKALILMNIQVSTVISSLSGKSGLRIVEAIIAGNRDAESMVDLLDPRIRAPREVLLKSLKGIWREDNIFELKQSYELYEFIWEKIRECDQKIEALLKAEAQRREMEDGEERSRRKAANPKPGGKNDPQFDLFSSFFQLSGVDISEIEGVGKGLTMTIIAEVGTDLQKKFPSANHFASWLGLAPNNKISGGKILSSKTPKNTNHLRQAFRDAAQSIGRLKKDSSLKLFFKRIEKRRGRARAITATARKLAVVVYNMITKQERYMPESAEKHLERVQAQAIAKVQRIINTMGIHQKDIIFS